MLNKLLWGGISFFEDSGLFPGVKHRNTNSLTAFFTEGTQTMVVQWWIFDLFDLACWGLQNANEHGVDLETQQRMIHLAKCEHVIHHLYHSGESFPHHERHPFRNPMKVVLSKSVCDQEHWVTSMTEDFLPATTWWVKAQKN
jgi:hypothetical protein